MHDKNNLDLCSFFVVQGVVNGVGGHGPLSFMKMLFLATCLAAAALFTKHGHVGGG